MGCLMGGLLSEDGNFVKLPRTCGEITLMRGEITTDPRGRARSALSTLIDPIHCLRRNFRIIITYDSISGCLECGKHAPHASARGKFYEREGKDAVSETI